jgi:hypothetical protein
VFTYNNTGGTGRPVSGSFIESDGTDNSTANSYAAFYANNVNGINGAFGVVVPNALPLGIRRVERRSLGTGAVTATATDADGVWPSGANTVNPSGGTAAIVLAGTDASLLTSIQSRDELPRRYGLDQNYPNPFNPNTNIKYSVPSGRDLVREADGQIPSTNSGFVSLKVFDVLGREVAILVNEEKQPGTYTVHWNADGLSSGVYFYRLQAGEYTATRKLALLK